MAKLEDIFYKNFAKGTLTTLSTPFYKKFANMMRIAKILQKMDSGGECYSTTLTKTTALKKHLIFLLKGGDEKELNYNLKLN